MDILELLTEEEDAIVAEALTAVTWLEHYERDGEDVARERLRALCRLVAGAIRTQDLEGLVAHAGRIARERHAAGYDRAEVVEAFSAVEQAIWHRDARRRCPSRTGPGRWASSEPPSTHAKDALTRAFVGAGSGDIPSFVDLSPLFRGGRDRARPVR